MKIKNIEGLSAQDIMQEAEQGARFVYFTYTISLVVVTFKRTSDVFLVRKGESRLKRKWPYILITVLFGCWGIPFGPKYSLQAIRTNIRGGKDVTDEVVSTVAGHILFREKERQKAPAC